MAGYNNDKPGVIKGNPFKTGSSPHQDVPKTKSSPTRGYVSAGQNRYKMRSPNRPDRQNAYRTITNPAMGKTKDWQTRGDKKKHVMGKAYSMNQVSVARIMKGNVNANEGAYMHRGGDKQS